MLSADLRRTETFYINLGFASEVVEHNGERPTLQAFERDGYYLLFYTEPPHGTSSTPTMSGTIYIFPESVDVLAEEWRGKVPFLWGPQLMPYGLYELGFADPDGYHLAFAERRTWPR
jgi:hypothetical protein